MIFTWLSFFIMGVVTFLFDGNYAALPENDTYSWLVVSICFLVFLFELVKQEYSKRTFMVFLFSFIIKIGVLVWIVYFSSIFTLPNTGSDNLFFHENASLLAQNTMPDRINPYTYLLSFVYRLYGSRIIIGNFMSVLFSVSTLYYFEKCLKVMDVSNQAYRSTILIFALLPNYLIISCVTLRESSIIFLLTLSAYLFICWWKTNKLSFFLFSILLCLVSGTLHSGAMFPAIGYMIYFIFYNGKEKNRNINVKTIFYLLFLSAIIFVFFQLFGNYLTAKFQNVESIEDSLRSIDTSRGGSGYQIGIRLGNPYLDLLINTPIRIIYFLISPLPWDWRGINDVFVFFADCVIYGSILWRYIKNMKKHKPMENAIFLAAFVTLIVFSWGVSNSGTALRHRTKLVTFFMLMNAVNIDTIRTKGEQRNE